MGIAMFATLLRWGYATLFFLALPFIFLRLALRGMKDPFYWKGWNQRLGRSPALEGVLWVHAVSMGETICIIPLVRSFIAQHGPQSVFMTTMTATGAAYLKKTLPQVPQAYVPYDIPCIWQRFFRRGIPKLLVLVETELWPNLLVACQKRHIPIFIANARLSPRSTKRYQKLPHHYWAPIVQVAAQSALDMERFKIIGIPAERVACVGNLKFDLTIRPEVITTGAALRQAWGNRPVWIAASTHEGEEAAALQAHADILKIFPNALLVIAPRHPERFYRVHALICKEGYTVARRSQEEPCTSDTAVYLADTLGELLNFYAVADVALVAGSLTPVGGHNPLEPAALGVPVLMGPEVFNCQATVDILVAAGGLKKISADTLGAAVLEWFENASSRRQAGENGQKVVEKNKGALTRTLADIERLMGRQVCWPLTND